MSAARFLVDADVLSEGTRPAPANRVLEWLRSHQPTLTVNPIILGELEYGILSLPAGRRRARLQLWLDAGAKRLPVINLDAATAATWASLLAELRRKGRAMPVNDSLIAATALQHGLTIATRNIADYKNAGVLLLNPFA